MTMETRLNIAKFFIKGHSKVKNNFWELKTFET